MKILLVAQEPFSSIRPILFFCPEAIIRTLLQIAQLSSDVDMSLNVGYGYDHVLEPRWANCGPLANLAQCLFL